MNPGGLVIVAAGLGLTYFAYQAAKSATSTASSLGSGVTSGVTAAVHGVGAGATATHHFLQTSPVKVGGAAPHDPNATETIGGKKYHPAKTKAGKWEWAAGAAPKKAPTKAPKKVAKTPPKTHHTTATKPKQSKQPTRAKAPGTGLLAI